MIKKINIEELNKQGISILLSSFFSTFRTEQEHTQALHSIISKYSSVNIIYLLGYASFLYEISFLCKWIKENYSNIEIMWGTKEIGPLPNYIYDYLKYFDYFKLNTKEGYTYYEVLHYPSNTGNLEPEHRLSDITYKFKK